MWPQIHQVTSLSLSFPTLQGFVSIKHTHTDKKPRAQQGLTKRYPPSQVPATTSVTVPSRGHSLFQGTPLLSEGNVTPWPRPKTRHRSHKHQSKNTKK